MRLLLDNVGRFLKPTQIEINGITVLAGENGTGKSTIGKIIYSVYSCFYDYQHQIMDERSASIYHLIRLVSRRRMSYWREYRHTKEKIGDLLYRYYENRNIGEVYNRLSDMINIDINEMPQELKDEVNDVLNASDEEILDSILRRILSQEFDSQLGHVNYKDIPSTVKVSIKDQSIEFCQTKDKQIHINDKINLIKEVVYVDDPNILDHHEYYEFGDAYSHRKNLVSKLIGDENPNFSAVNDVVATRNLKEILDKLSAVCSGKLQFTAEGALTYSDDSLREGLSLSNLSTGLKSFVILKTLLQKGYLEKNGMIVLDEPEAHQHPEWMRIYAELVVLLQVVLDINIVISTHSADFLSFIELYAKKYDIEGKCKYYLLSADSNDTSTSVLGDVTGQLDQIYSRLSKPFLQATEEFDILNESE